MNLRLSPGSVRMRLSHSELDVLLTTGEISSGTRLSPHHEFTYRVTLDDNALELLLDTTENGLQLRLSGTLAREFAARLPSKQGIEVQQADGHGGMLVLSLEVDIHSRRNTTR